MALISIRALLLLLTCLPQPALAGPCPFGITPETAQRLFDRMKQISAGAGYRFEGLGTNKTEMSVLWSRDGKACPPIRVIIRGCTPLFGLPALELDVPPGLPASCPGLEPVLQALSSALPAEHLAGQSPSMPVAALPGFTAVIGLVAGAGLLIRHFLTPSAARVGWGGIGWVAFTLAAAIPFVLDVPVAVTVELAIMWVAFAVLLGCARRLFYGPLPPSTELRTGLVAMRCHRKNSSRALHVRGRERIESGALTLSLLGLFGFSLLLHWSLASGGPGDLHLNLAAIWSPELELRWGPAPVALFRFLGYALGDIRDTEIIWCNLILSSLLPMLLYALVAGLGVSQPAALLAAFVVAAHPLLIAFSGVLERQPTYMFAACGSIVALIGFLKHGRWSLFIAFVLGTILATTSRPEGAQVLILDVAVVLAAGDWNLVGFRSRFARAAPSDPTGSGRAEKTPAAGPAGLALVLLFPLAFAYVHTLESKFPGSGDSLAGQAPFLWTVLFDRDFTPLAWIVAWTVGLALGIRRRAAWVALLSLLGLDILWRWTGVYHMFVGHPRQVASARYESILLVPFAIGIALLIEAFLGARRWVKVGLMATFVACTAATFQRPFDTLVKPFTVDYEYRFLKKYALTLPPGARLFVFDAPLDDVGLIDAHLVGQFVGSSVDFVSWSARRCDAFLPGSSPTYLYIGSSCSELIEAPHRQLPSSYAGWIQDCAAIRERVSGDPVEVIDVPAHKMSWHDFKGSTVRLALYRLKDPSICALGPSYPWRAEGG